MGGGPRGRPRLWTGGYPERACCEAWAPVPNRAIRGSRAASRPAPRRHPAPEPVPPTGARACPWPRCSLPRPTSPACAGPCWPQPTPGDCWPPGSPARPPTGCSRRPSGSFVLFSPERQATAGQVAAAFALLLLPYSLLGPFTGVFLDRWNRARVLVVANLARGLVMIGIALMVAAGRDGLDLGTAVLITMGIGRLWLAGLSAGLPLVVAPAHLVTANALFPTAGTIAAAIATVTGLLLMPVARTRRGQSADPAGGRRPAALGRDRDPDPPSRPRSRGRRGRHGLPDLRPAGRGARHGRGSRPRPPPAAGPSRDGRGDGPPGGVRRPPGRRPAAGAQHPQHPRRPGHRPG